MCQRVAAIANRRRLGRCPPPATTLVQHRRYRAVLSDDGGFQLHVSPHAATMIGTPQDDNLIQHTLLSPLTDLVSAGFGDRFAQESAPVASASQTRPKSAASSSMRRTCRAESPSSRAARRCSRARVPSSQFPQALVPVSLERRRHQPVRRVGSVVAPLRQTGSHGMPARFHGENWSYQTVRLYDGGPDGATQAYGIRWRTRVVERVLNGRWQAWTIPRGVCI